MSELLVCNEVRHCLLMSYLIQRSDIVSTRTIEVDGDKIKHLILVDNYGYTAINFCPFCGKDPNKALSMEAFDILLEDSIKGESKTWDKDAFLERMNNKEQK